MAKFPFTICRGWSSGITKVNLTKPLTDSEFQKWSRLHHHCSASQGNLIITGTMTSRWFSSLIWFVIITSLRLFWKRKLISTWLCFSNPPFQVFNLASSLKMQFKIQIILVRVASVLLLLTIAQTMATPNPQDQSPCGGKLPLTESR